MIISKKSQRNVVFLFYVSCIYQNAQFVHLLHASVPLDAILACAKTKCFYPSWQAKILSKFWCDLQKHLISFSQFHDKVLMFFLLVLSFFFLISSVLFRWVLLIFWAFSVPPRIFVHCFKKQTWSAFQSFC